MTWGQLRFQLQTSMPGVPLDLLDEWLAGRYEQVLESADWTGKRSPAVIQTVAAYQSGADSVSLTVGSASVVGSGTAWTSAATVGMKFYRPGDSALYQVVAWSSATNITLDRPYDGPGDAVAGYVYVNSPYVLCQNVYHLPANTSSVVGCMDPVTGLPMPEFSRDQLDESAGSRCLLGDPRCWALADDTDDGMPPVLHQIEFFPPPLYARGIPIEYLHSAEAFDGSNTGSSPMPWVSNSVLLYGCRADGYAYLAGAAEDSGERTAYLRLAKMSEAKFGEGLQRLLLVEFQQRRPKVALQMASRFTKHRLTRTLRGATRNGVRGVDGPDSSWSQLNPSEWSNIQP